MGAKTASHALTVNEVLDLPAMVDGWPTAAAACGGISRTTWYELARNGETPVPVIRVGRTQKVRRADLLAFLGLEDSDAAGAASPAAPVERTSTSTIK